MSNLPKIAVLMATYNGARFLREQLDSLLAQEAVEVTIYVRDDRSTDNTLSILNEYAATGKLVLLPTKPEQLRVTRNFYSILKEVDLAPYDAFCYSDQDDIWLPEKLIQAWNAMQIQQADCYASNLLRADADGKLIEEKSFLKKVFQYILNNKTGKQTEYDYYFEAASAGCTLVLKKTAAVYFQKRIREIYDRLPVDTSHDWSTYAITRLGGFRWFIDPASYILYRQHAENNYGAHTGMGGVKKLLEWFTSGRYRMHILMIDELYNNTGSHPAFMKAVRGYRHNSIFSRARMATAVSGYRRKWVHRIALFLLIMAGYCK